MKKFNLEGKVVAKDKDLESIISACGIEYPHESLGFFKSVYAKFEEPNKNGVILANSVKEQVGQLIGCQVNANHWRQNWVLGTILDSWVEDDKIVIAFSFYKSIYPDLYEEAITQFESGDLTVSFELMVADEDVERVNGGYRKLNAVSFDGVGLLFDESPACPEAVVFEQAKVEKLRKQDLVFAKKIEDSKKISNKEDENVKKEAKDALLAKFKEDIIAELGEEAVKDWSDEKWESELAKRANGTSYECKCLDCGKTFNSENHCKDTKCPECGGESRRKDRPGSGDKASEEDKKDEEAFEKEDSSEEEAKMVVKTEILEEYDENSEKFSQKQVIEQDGEKIVEMKETRETVYSQEDVDKIKAEYEDQLKAKDEEMAKIKENAELIAQLKVELGDYVKDFSDDDFLNEDKLKIARLTKENDELKGVNSLETASEDESKEEEENAEEKEADSEKVDSKEEDSEEKAEEETEDDSKEEANSDSEDSQDDSEESSEDAKDEEDDMSTAHDEQEVEEELSEDELLDLAIKNRCKD
ncbi:MAG: hypothetical protein ACTSWG_10500 [Candidatus Helarchaeota archaeon]